MRTLVFSIFIALSFFSYSQSSLNIDSVIHKMSLNEQYNTLDSLIKFNSSSELTQRLKLSRQLLNVAKKIGKKEKIGSAYYELTYSYEIIGEYDSALENALTAIKIFRETENKRMISMTLNEIGLIFLSNTDPASLQKAVHYFHLFLNGVLPLKDTMEIAGAYSNIGLAYTYLDLYDSALFYTREALELRKKINHKLTTGISYGNIAFIYSNTGVYDSVIYYNNLALDIYNKENYLYGINEIYNSKLSFYINIKNYDSAKVYAFKRLEIAKKIESKYIFENTYYSMVKYFKAIGDYENAFKYFELYNEIEKEIQSDETLDKIAVLQTIYDFERKENQIVLLEEKDRINYLKQVLLVVGIILLLITSIVVIVSIRRKRIKDRQLHNAEKQVHLKDKQLAQVKLEKSQAKEQELNKEIEYKSKQLTTHALNMMQKNKLLQELHLKVKEITRKVEPDIKPECRRLGVVLSRTMQAEKDWELFKNYFEDVNKGFYEKLYLINSELSPNDFKLCALIRLNMNIKETASVLNISPDSVKTARYRLRKKLNLEGETDLYEFISQID
jgi:tetratricopeptide (TPR) repeat protein